MQYALLNSDPQLREFFAFIEQHSLRHELHLNRTRVWIDPSPILTEFLLRFTSVFPVLDDI